MKNLITKLRRLFNRYFILTYAQREWLRDLRSGQFAQAAGSLQHENRFCCLGVACKTYERVTNNRADYYEDGRVELQGGTLLDQPRVQDWLGLISVTGYFGTFASPEHSLVRLNDMGVSFAQIADIIEDNAGVLFRKK